jgi:cytochrome c biogenesis protein CcmG/thiol:disulfide interchange protein DsbE
MRFIPFALLGLFIVLAYFILTSPQRPQQVPQFMTGKPLPELSLSTVDGGAEAPLSSHLKGKPVMINFFASWCAPCRHEVSALLALKQKRLLPIIGIAWKDKAVDTQAMLSKHGNPYDVVLSDLDGTTTVPFALTGVPEMVVVGADGIILYHSKATLTEESIEEEILPLLEGKK